MKRLHFGVIGVVGQSTQCTSLHLQAEQLARGRRSALKERSRMRQCQDFCFFIDADYVGVRTPKMVEKGGIWTIVL